MGELSRGSETGGAGADNRYFTGVLLRFMRVVVVEVIARPVGDESFDMADRDGIAFVAANASTFTLLLLWTDTAGNPGQRVVAKKRFGGAGEITRGHTFDKCRNIDRDGTASDALWILAIQTPLRFEHRDLFGKA
jgi:hypothetical protein